jgi:four helix bundle protein
MPHSDFNSKYAERTKQLSISIIRWYAGLSGKTDEVRILGKQLIRSVTSTAANFRASCRARSTSERFAKLCIVVEEIDETVFWLELFQETEIAEKTILAAMQEEALQILKVMASTRRKLK